MPKTEGKKVSFSVKKEDLDVKSVKQIKMLEDPDTFSRDDCNERDYNDDGGNSRKNRKK